jgi:hypothetical protein
MGWWAYSFRRTYTFGLAACGGEKKKEFFGDTPNPGRGLTPSALRKGNEDRGEVQWDLHEN